MKEVRRLAVLVPTSQMGGAEISLVEMVKALKGDPHVTVIVPGNGALMVAAENAGASTEIVEMPGTLARTGEVARSSALRSAIFAMPALVTYILRLSVGLRRARYDMLVTNGIKAHVAGTIAARLARLPVVWHLRDSLEERAVTRRVLALLSPLASGAIAISNYVAESSGNAVRRRLAPVVIYNPVNAALFNGAGSVPEDLVKPEDEVWFAIIGALTPLKGQDLFLEAASQVAAKLENARFFVVGGSFYQTETGTGYANSLVSQSKSVPLAGKVRFLGPRSDIEAVISAMDVIVHSNRGPEGLGRVILEAMSDAKPVIAFAHGGPAEILEAGVTGELVPRGDVGALAERMIMLAHNPDRRRALGMRARSWIEANLDSARIAESFRVALNNSI